MPIFVIFVFGAVILGAGTMLSPAWPTRQPRVGLGAAFSLAIIVGGTIFYASLFGWDTLVIDYLLFALVTGIFLGGTLSVAQSRAEDHGQTLRDEDQGWPGPQDLAFFALVALIFIVPVLVLPVPLGADGQGYGYLALVTREGRTFHTFAPFQPEIEYLYPPGFGALTAYLSRQLNQSIHAVQFSVGAVLSLLCVWLAYDLGAEIRDKRLGRALALAMLLSLGVFGAFVAGHYAALLGLLFVLAFITYTVRYTRHRYPADAIAAGLMLGAAALSHPGMTIAAGLGFVPWLATIWLGEPRPSLKTWLVMAVGIPLVAVLAISPWLADVLDLMRADFASPFERSVDNLTVMLQYHGIWIVPLALVGAWLGWTRRDPVAILSIGWLLLVLDFSTTGGIASLFPFVTRFVHPLDLAWHGPIIPYSILGGMALLWLWDEYILPHTGAINYRQAYAINAALVVLVLLAAAFNRQLLDISRGLLDDRAGAYATDDDIRAMQWIEEHAPADAHVLNFPTSDGGGWVPAVAERETIYYPQLPYAQINPDSREEQEMLEAFWHNPADSAHADLLRDAGIDYVIAPQIVANRERDETAWRWRRPAAWDFEMRSDVSEAAYLELVFDAGGARVYRVRD